ncbi:MAG TPA: sugar phosphate isomerase/epimerase family protein [Verrucomicrobiota bacterium]|nr:sugar phosphate isomerase/epimerase family protein [Verrucomicrobiota bacterium]
MATSLSDRLGVCSWSLQPESADDLLGKLAQTGISKIQIALDPIRENKRGAWTDFAKKCASQNVKCVSGMFATVGEDYSTLESIKRTGGVVPDHTWEENWRNIQADLELAAQLGLPLVTFHAGFLPHDENDPQYRKLQDRIRRIAELFAKRGITLTFETGQETAETLRGFLEKLNCPGVGVNLDPANMILYDKGNPIDALRVLGPWIRQCHMKDARRTKVPGTWGEEVVLGTGEVDWPAFLSGLGKLGFAGYLCIEREAGNQRVADIRTAKEFLERVAAEVQ